MTPEQVAALKKGDVLWKPGDGRDGGSEPNAYEVHVLSAGPKQAKLGDHEDSRWGWMEFRSNLEQRYFLTEGEAALYSLKQAEGNLGYYEKELAKARARLEVLKKYVLKVTSQ